MTGTSGGFTPAAQPPCPYPNRMTIAEAKALRLAGGLVPDCVVILTDGPTIGTAGNTSPTEIELNPVGPSELGTTARVHTNFSGTAWHGLFDIDLGTGSITRLTDDWGNTAVDIDANSPTVQTQFPWHKGANAFRDNYVQDSTLPGWDNAVGTLSRNRVISSTVDLTGKTAGTVLDNEITNASLVLGAGGGLSSLIRCKVTALSLATPVINHTGTGNLTFTDVIQRDGFIVVHTGSGNLSVSNTTLESHGTGPADLNHAATGTASTLIGDSRIVAAGNANPAIDNQGATNGLIIGFSELIQPHIVRAAGTNGPLTIQQCKVRGTEITIGPANAALVNVFNNVDMVLGIFTLNGPVAAPGRNDIGPVGRLNMGVTVAATATAGVQIQGGDYENVTVTQNRTAGTGSLGFFSCTMKGFSTITDHGTTDPGQPLGFNRCRIVDSVVDIGNMGVISAPGTVMQQTDVIGSTLNLSGLTGTKFLDKGRLQGAVLSNAGFSATVFEIVGLTKTFTADQPANRHASVVFDNVI